MRIIAGSRRGHKLIEFPGMDVRPTTDRVRESVFNIIQAYVPDAKVLDLFTGSGALSLEAVSRGAQSAVCVDIDDGSLDIARRNVAALRFEDKCTLVRASCFDYLKSNSERFDIIFLDPPYNKGYIEPVLRDIILTDALNDDGIIMLESDGTDFHSDVDGLSVYRQRKYGRTYITIYKKDKK